MNVCVRLFLTSLLHVTVLENMLDGDLSICVVSEQDNHMSVSGFFNI